MRLVIAQALADALHELHNAPGAGTPYCDCANTGAAVIDGVIDLQALSDKLIEKLAKEAFAGGEHCTVKSVIGLLIDKEADEEIWVEESADGGPIHFAEVGEVEGDDGRHVLFAIERCARPAQGARA